MSWWPAIVFGWPAVAVAILLSVVDIVKRIAMAPVIAALMVTPFFFYLGATPRIGWPRFLMPLLLLAAGLAVRYRQTGIAWTLVAPVVAMAGGIALLLVVESA